MVPPLVLSVEDVAEAEPDAAVDGVMGRVAVPGDQAGTAVDDEIDAMLAEELELEDLVRDSEQQAR
eukprot:SAG22_NODE_1240_length_5042_cov_103.645964_3_plen_66_part_00